MQEEMIGALKAPHDFRRATGAHEILASLLGAEVLGVLAMALLGAVVIPVAWWAIRWLGLWVHGSLLLDIGLILILACIANGLRRQVVLKMNRTDAWNDPLVGITLLAVLLAILRVLPWGWMDIPAQIIPRYPLERVPWPTFSPQGAAIAVALVMLVHLLVFRAYRKQQRKDLAYARAHPGGNLTRLVGQAYEHYEHALARFNPSPVPHLKTPRSFLYYDEKELPERPGRAIYWNNSRSLILSYALLAPPSAKATTLLPEQENLLLPLLARLLYDLNSLTLQTERVLWYARIASDRWDAQLLLSIPVLAAHFCQQRWEALERERVLDRDRFAYWCGEALRLLRLLRQQLRDQQEAGLPDNAVPMLHERIDHLEGLVKLEQRQVEQLKAALSIAPPTAP